MLLHQALHRLAEDSLLAAMPEQLAVQVKAAASVRKIERGGVVILQGQPADKLIIPVDGPLRLVTRTPTDSTTLELRARRALNLGEMLAGGRWSYSAFADADVHVVEVDANTFRDVLRAAPSYARYLYRIAGLRTVRAAAGVLRRAGLHPRKVQRLFILLEDRTVAAGGMLAEHGEPPWVLVDTGALDLLRDDGGERLELTTLEPGEFYGAAAALRRSLPLQMRARDTTRLLLIEANRLRGLCASDDELARVLRMEHPEVQRRVRRAFLESGQVFTDQMLAVAPRPDHDDEGDDGPDGSVARAAKAPTVAGVEVPHGKTWVPPARLARRFEGVRSALVEDSGAAALASVLQYYDRTLAFASVRRALQRRSPPSLLELAQVAERQGLMTHAAKLASPARMRELRAPFVLMIGHQYVVTHQVLRRSIRVFSPVNGLCELSMSELEPGWSGAVLSFSDVRSFMRELAPATELDSDAKAAVAKAPVAKAPATTAGKRGAYFQLFGDVRGAMTAAVVVALGVLALSVVGPRLNGLVVDQVIAYGDRNLLVVVAIGLVLVHLSSFLLSGFRELALAYLGGLIEHRLSSLSLRHTLGIALEAHGDDRVGAALERLNELNRIRTSISTDVIQLTLQIAKGAVYLLLVIYYSWKLGLIVVAGVPASYLIVLATRKRYRQGYVEMFEENSRMQSQTTEQVEQVATIKALGGGAAAQKRWEQTLVTKLGVERRLVRVQTGAQLAFNVVEESIRIGATYLAVKLVLGGSMSPGTLLAVSQYVTGALAPLLAIAGKLEEFAQAGVSLRKLDELFAHPLEDDETAAVRAEIPFDGAITARDVSFAYGNGAPVLRGVSFEIKAGQTIAIVGRSGSGKTTLAKLLHGALRPTSGELFFDDQDSRSLSLPAIRRNVGIVLQDSQLFAGTITENIAYGDDRPEHIRVHEAARLAAAHDFIMSFPARYNTYLAEGGLGLSGGQRQRVSIARALFRSPRILILDEATSALDAESERAIIANMPDILRGRTGIVIAHRLTTVKHADRILVIDDGQIVEDGSHDELVAKRGLYHSLFDRQFHQG